MNTKGWFSKLRLRMSRYCWRAVARQPTILYNSKIWPKSVGCKIVDLRSRMRSLYPGACGFGDMRCRFRATAVINQGHVKRGQFLYRCLLRVVLKAGMPETRNAGNPECGNAGMPECRNAVMPECRNAGNQDPEIKTRKS